MKDKLTMSSIEKIVDTFIVDEWSSIARLYDVVVLFAAAYKGLRPFSGPYVQGGHDKKWSIRL